VRAILIFASALTLGGCGAIQQAEFDKARNEAMAAYSKCLADNVASPENQVVSKRVWQGNSDTVAAKLTDPNPLTQPEKDALVVVHSRGLECRKIAFTPAALNSSSDIRVVTHWRACWRRPTIPLGTLGDAHVVLQTIHSTFSQAHP
jgi:hypothetical protein